MNCLGEPATIAALNQVTVKVVGSRSAAAKLSVDVCARSHNYHFLRSGAQTASMSSPYRATCTGDLPLLVGAGSSAIFGYADTAIHGLPLLLLLWVSCYFYSSSADVVVTFRECIFESNNQVKLGIHVIDLLSPDRERNGASLNRLTR